MTNELARLGIAFTYREHEWLHPHAGRHFPTRQELPALVECLKKQRRDPYPRILTVVHDASHLTEFDTFPASPPSGAEPPPYKPTVQENTMPCSVALSRVVCCIPSRLRAMASWTWRWPPSRYRLVAGPVATPP